MITDVTKTYLDLRAQVEGKRFIRLNLNSLIDLISTQRTTQRSTTQMGGCSCGRTHGSTRRCSGMCGDGSRRSCSRQVVRSARRPARHHRWRWRDRLLLSMRNDSDTSRIIHRTIELDFAVLCRKAKKRKRIGIRSANKRQHMGPSNGTTWFGLIIYSRLPSSTIRSYTRSVALLLYLTLTRLSFT